jgi:hypothetical protein
MARGRPRRNPEDVLIRSAELIGWALGGIEREIIETRSRLAALTTQAAQLRKRMGIRGPGRPPASAAPATEAVAAPTGRTRRRRKMSPEARKRISEMMKKRWAERKRAR